MHLLLIVTPLPMNFCAMISNFCEQNLASSWRNPWMTLLLTSLHQLLLYTLLAFSSTKCVIKKGKTTSYYSTTFSRPFIQIHHLMIPSNKPLFNVPLISDKNVEFHAFQRRNNYFCTWDKPVKWMLLKNYQNSISVRRRETAIAVRLPTYFCDEIQWNFNKNCRKKLILCLFIGSIQPIRLLLLRYLNYALNRPTVFLKKDFISSRAHN